MAEMRPFNEVFGAQTPQVGEQYEVFINEFGQLFIKERSMVVDNEKVEKGARILMRNEGFTEGRARELSRAILSAAERQDYPAQQSLDAFKHTMKRPMLENRTKVAIYEAIIADPIHKLALLWFRTEGQTEQHRALTRLADKIREVGL